MALQTTRHFEQRVRQRGYNGRDVKLLFEYGETTRGGLSMPRNRAVVLIDIRKRRIRDLNDEVRAIGKRISALRAEENTREEVQTLKDAKRERQREISRLHREIQSLERLARKRTFVPVCDGRAITIQPAAKWKARRERLH